MKKITLSLLLTLAVIGFGVLTASAQNAKQTHGIIPALTAAQGWQNAILRADGFTEVNGVEAYCMRTTCGNEDYILVKFVNKNNYNVRVEWNDAIYVKGTWFYSKTSKPKVFMLNASQEVTGDCQGDFRLKVSVSSIIENPSDLEHYTVAGLSVK
jgi:hypothetical protein